MTRTKYASPTSSFHTQGTGQNLRGVVGDRISFARVPPDLVVEVLSPSDVSYEVDRRVQDYLGAGVKLVWVVHPQSRSVHVYRPGGQGVILSERDELEGEQVLPGFRLPVREIFRPLEQLPQTGSGPSKGMSG
jgi:Uma2 family endonuclease